MCVYWEIPDKDVNIEITAANSVSTSRLVHRETDTVWVQSWTPAHVFRPSLSAGVITLLYFSPAWSPERLAHTPKHSLTHTQTQSPSGQAWRCWCSLSTANLEQPGWSAAVCWMENLWTDSIIQLWLETSAACFTMEFGRVWSRYQRTVLITMMMFKLGKASTCAVYYYCRNVSTLPSYIHLCHTSE